MSTSRLTKILPVLAFAAIAAVTPTRAQERYEIPAFRIYGEPSPAHAATLDAFLRNYWSAWGRQDAERLAALHANDTEWINAYARMFQDSASLGAFLGNRLFPAFDPAVSLQEAQNARLVSLRYLGDDAAIAHYFTEGNRGASRNDGEARRRTHIHLVMERHGAEWRIVHTAILDAR